MVILFSSYIQEHLKLYCVAYHRPNQSRELSPYLEPELSSARCVGSRDNMSELAYDFRGYSHILMLRTCLTLLLAVARLTVQAA